MFNICRTVSRAASSASRMALRSNRGVAASLTTKFVPATATQAARRPFHTSLSNYASTTDMSCRQCEQTAVQRCFAARCYFYSNLFYCLVVSLLTIPIAFFLCFVKNFHMILNFQTSFFALLRHVSALFLASHQQNVCFLPSNCCRSVSFACSLTFFVFFLLKKM